jgi:hypothetical protein
MMFFILSEGFKHFLLREEKNDLRTQDLTPSNRKCLIVKTISLMLSEYLKLAFPYSLLMTRKAASKYIFVFISISIYDKISKIEKLLKK